MKHNYLNNTPLLKARKEYLAHITERGFNYKTEAVHSAASHGRVLSEAVYAKICSPHYNASAMDGIAVKASDTYGANESNPVILTRDMYTVVDTGDPIPDSIHIPCENNSVAFICTVGVTCLYCNSVHSTCVIVW